MRFAFAAVAALCAALVSAQNNAISIPAGAATLDVTAGQPLTIQWTDPSSGTVTIKLQQDPITPAGGVVLASAIPASDGTATLQIPPPQDVNSHIYTIEIIDDTNSANINFSPSFGINGATGTAVGTASTGSVTASTDSATSSGTSSGTSSTDSSTITTTDSSSSSATNSSSSSTESSASTTNSQQSSSSTSSAAPTESTSAPNSSGNGAGSLKVQGGLLAAAVGLIAVM